MNITGFDTARSAAEKVGNWKPTDRSDKIGSRMKTSESKRLSFGSRLSLSRLSETAWNFFLRFNCAVIGFSIGICESKKKKVFLQITVKSYFLENNCLILHKKV